jgi:hypothetical protein
VKPILEPCIVLVDKNAPGGGGPDKSALDPVLAKLASKGFDNQALIVQNSTTGVWEYRYRGPSLHVLLGIMEQVKADILRDLL